MELLILCTIAYVSGLSTTVFILMFHRGKLHQLVDVVKLLIEDKKTPKDVKFFLSRHLKDIGF